MSNVNSSGLGNFIKQARKKRGLTQEQLCFGLCDISTLSRIERGITTPQNYLRNAILERLGYYFERERESFWESGSPELTRHKRIMSIAVAQKDITMMEKLVAELENEKEFKNGIGLQFLQNSKVAVSIFKESEYERFDFDETLKLLYEAISVTIPNFDRSKIREYMLTGEEMRSINLLCGIYYRQNDYENALDVIVALKDNIEKHCVNLHDISMYYSTILSNVADLHFQLKQYDKCISASEMCRNFCVEHYEYGKVPELLYMLGQCFFETGKLEEAKNVLYDAYHVSRAFCRQEYFEDIANYYFETFGCKINLHNAICKRPTEYETEHVKEYQKEYETDDGTGERINRLLAVTRNDTVTAKELMQRLKLSSKSNFTYRYLRPAIEAGLIEMTIPDNPRSRRQKYRAT